MTQTPYSRTSTRTFRAIPLSVATVAVAAMLAGGCTADPATGQASGNGDDEATVFDPMVGTMDRARAAGDELDERTDRLRSRVDASLGQVPDEDDNP